MNLRPTFTEDLQGLEVSGESYSLRLHRRSGELESLRLDDGIAWREILLPRGAPGGSGSLPVVSWRVVPLEGAGVAVDIGRESADWRIDSRYEVRPRGYLECSFVARALREGAILPDLRAGVTLAEATVFGGRYSVRNLVDDISDHRFPRALSLDFSTDSRPVSSSVDVLLELAQDPAGGGPWHKVLQQEGGGRYLGWRAERSGSAVPRGHRISNRWALSWTTSSLRPNPVRGQRIYHWYGLYPRYPADDLVDEMAEYGATILILHMPSFSSIAGSEPADPAEMRRVLARAHEAGMQVLFYCQPALVSVHAPQHARLSGMRTDTRLIWHSMKDTQIVFYEPDESYDSDELCLSCPEAFDFIRDSVLDCFRRYGFDGLYVDWAWPAQGLCSDPRHGHGKGFYGFHDYWRMLREWRKGIGDGAPMIGHGGGLLVGSDFVEGFDACLTGEAQARLDPVTLGSHYGTIPTLWTMHRRKQDVFRSARAVDELVREGVSPHVGLGVMGTSILATLDPAHWPEVLVLWQIWRAFPVERSRCFTYLAEPVVQTDNGEVFHHVFVAADEPEGARQALVVLSNGGGPFHDGQPVAGVRVRLDLARLGLSSTLRCARIRGRSYETVRIADAPPVRDGVIDVAELLLHEVTGFVLSPGEPPKELDALRRHLEGRARRLPRLLAAKVRRMEEMDRMLDRFAELPQRLNRKGYGEFMKGRTAE